MRRSSGRKLAPLLKSVAKFIQTLKKISPKAANIVPGALQTTYGFLNENLQFPLERPTRAPPAQDRPDGAAGVTRWDTP